MPSLSCEFGWGKEKKGCTKRAFLVECQKQEKKKQSVRKTTTFKKEDLCSCNTNPRRTPGLDEMHSCPICPPQSGWLGEGNAVAFCCQPAIPLPDITRGTKWLASQGTGTKSKPVQWDKELPRRSYVDKKNDVFPDVKLNFHSVSWWKVVFVFNDLFPENWKF